MEQSGIFSALQVYAEYSTHVVTEGSGFFGWCIQRRNLLELAQKLTVLIEILIQSTKGKQSTRGHCGLLQITTTTTSTTTTAVVR